MTTPTAEFVLKQIVRERKEAALQGERITAEDIAVRWESNHKIRSLLPSDPTIREYIHHYIVQRARIALGQERDEKGSRLILSPIPLGIGHKARGYVGREAMTVGEHLDLGNHQMKTGTRKLTEGRSRVGLGGQALELGRTMAEPLGELAAEVSADDEADGSAVSEA